MGTEWEVVGKVIALWGYSTHQGAQELTSLLEGGSHWGALEAWLAHHGDFADNFCWVLVKPCLK